MFKAIFQSIHTSMVSLLANKVRSFLTMLGIIIGVGAVIIIMAVGSGAQSLILAEVKKLGTDKIGVLPGNSGDDGPPTAALGVTITTLTYDDAKALNNQKNVPNIVDVVAYTKGNAKVTWRSNTIDASISGTTVGYLTVEEHEVEAGRFFTKEEEQNLSRVAVLGSETKKELFGDSEALGQRIKIKKHVFEVIGVMEERGTVAFTDYDNQIIIPIKTMQKLIAGVDYLGFLRAKIADENDLEKTLEDVRMTLRDQHDIKDHSGKDDDFTVRSAAEALDMITTITDSLRYFLAAMAALSLLVGGIGIMNIMLVSVSERTREIGLRKAIGANNKHILNQFLIEAITVTSIGGFIGIAGGVILSYVISVVIQALDYNWDFILSINSILLGLAVSTVVGLVFGIFPAYKASKLEPVEALRYE